MSHARTLVSLLVLVALGASPTSADDSWRRLPLGTAVEVEGDWALERGVVAKEIDVRPNVDSGKVELVAPLQAIELPVARVRLLGVVVAIPPGCRVRDEAGLDVALEGATPGTWVEIDAESRSEGLVARRVRILSAPRRRIEIEGAITSLALGDRLAVAGVSVRVHDEAVTRGAPRLHIPLAVDDDDGRPPLLGLFRGRLRIGGRVQMEYEPEQNFDLNPVRPGDLSRSQWSAEVQLDMRLSPAWQAYLKAGATSRRIHLDEEGDELNRSQSRVQQLFVIWRPAAAPFFAAQVGRQDFDEPREWLYDENLDGIRLHFQAAGFRTELSASRRWNTTSSRLSSWSNWIAVARRPVLSRWVGEGYVIHRRRDSDPGNRPTWAGLRSFGRLAGGLRHWAELSFLRGQLDQIPVSAYAWDLGLRWRLDLRWRPSATVGWAVGSGGPDRADHFRQTGFHDNNDKFGGVSSFRYYGELLEPELANISIATLGFGFRPSGRSSFDLVFHDYRQRFAQAILVDSNLESRPRGTDPHLGRELDVILAFEEIPGLDLEYVFAWFEPGRAFNSRATAARFHKLAARYAF